MMRDLALKDDCLKAKLTLVCHPKQPDRERFGSSLRGKPPKPPVSTAVLHEEKMWANLRVKPP